MDKKRKEVIKDVLIAYANCNNMPLHISKKRWLDYVKGIDEDDKIIAFLNGQMHLLKRILDNLLEKDTKLPARSTIFTVEASDLIKEFLEKK